MKAYSESHIRILSRKASLKVGSNLYGSAGEVALEIVRSEGALSLFRGASLQFAKVCPVFFFTMPLYEQLRRLVGLGYLRT